MDVGELILQVINSLTLLSYVLLIVICLVSYGDKQILNIFKGDRTGLHVFDCLP